jgi:hypothetical protein
MLESHLYRLFSSLHLLHGFQGTAAMPSAILQLNHRKSVLSKSKMYYLKIKYNRFFKIIIITLKISLCDNLRTTVSILFDPPSKNFAPILDRTIKLLKEKFSTFSDGNMVKRILSAVTRCIDTL